MFLHSTGSEQAFLYLEQDQGKSLGHKVEILAADLTDSNDLAGVEF